jgi:DegV family protein with EDD domain
VSTQHKTLDPNNKKDIMAKIAIITDSDSSLPAQTAAEHGILQVPILVHFDGRTYTTGVDIDDRLLFEMIDKSNRLPTTSAPNPADFVNAFQKAFDQGAEGIICICVSSLISSTYSSAEAARERFPERDIRVIDSMRLTMAQGYMTLAAAEAAERGASLDEIEAIVKTTGPKLHTFAVLSTLKYLAMSGRVGKLVAGLADTFNIKVILTVKDGKLGLLEKIRTRRKAVERLQALLVESVNGQKVERISVIHVNEPQGAAEMEALLRETFDCPEKITIAEFTAGLSVHAGAGLVGVVVQTA